MNSLNWIDSLTTGDVWMLYRIPPSNQSIKNAYYCTFCKKSFESAYSLEKVKSDFSIVSTIFLLSASDLDKVIVNCWRNVDRTTWTTYLVWSVRRSSSFCSIIPSSPISREKDVLKLQPVIPMNNAMVVFNKCQKHRKNIVQDTIWHRLLWRIFKETSSGFDTQLAQQVMQNAIQPQNSNPNRFQRGGPNRRRGRNRPPYPGQQSFRGRGGFQQPYGQPYNQGKKLEDDSYFMDTCGTL